MDRIAMTAWTLTLIAGVTGGSVCLALLAWLDPKRRRRNEESPPRRGLRPVILAVTIAIGVAVGGAAGPAAALIWLASVLMLGWAVSVAFGRLPR